MTVAGAIIPATRLEDTIRALFPRPVAVAVTDPTAPQPVAFAAETRAIASAREKRRHEFLAGRAAVQAAMRQMGQPPVAVPAGADRAPIWPDGLTGSISHSDSLCAAVLADTRSFPALGIDIEPAEPLAPDLVPEICTLSERAWLSAQPEPGRGLLARLIFSAKECAYKCQYTLSRTMLEFTDLEITADLETGQFEATFLRAVPAFEQGTRLYGRHMTADGHVITGIAARQLAAAPQERRLSPW